MGPPIRPAGGNEILAVIASETCSLAVICYFAAQLKMISSDGSSRDANMLTRKRCPSRAGE